ncbi:lipocalin family protein [uncultured Sphingomonas sp.]|jgi:apolipoprotein D and lipocalin family protein|uniref:lipocalin family protein n=1 Tax=unclassified Sphingomonas TaxID=196159 RepID=UPI0025E95522|nr:lipocalin family protein [uncultured Sphingomonas sp.]
MRKLLVGAAAIGIPAVLAACVAIPRPGPVGNRSVPDPARPVDLPQYLGRWYEQFRYEASFQKGMDAVMAFYSLNDDGSIRVVNSGRKGGVNGKEKSTTGKAKIVDPATNAKLKVSFFGPFYGDYWVLDHGDNYEWSIVGEPSGRYLWALTREKKPSAETMELLKKRVQELGYDWSLVRVTAQ